MKSIAKAKATCRYCGEKTSIGENTKNGQIIVCQFCGVELELINLDPIVLDWPYYVEDDLLNSDEVYLYDEEY